MADDEAEIYDGARAQFPLSFGKQAKSQTSLELVHNATRRNNTSAAAGAVTQPADGKLEPSPFPSLSSSSKSWLNSLKNPKSKIIGPSRPPTGLSSSYDKEEEEEDEDGAIIGPPRPTVDAKTEEDEDGEMIGPPRPPLEEEDGLIIGPPPPPSGSMGSDSEDDMEEEEEAQNQYRIPLSNEIVLKGHTKVPFFFMPSLMYMYGFLQLLLHSQFFQLRLCELSRVGPNS